MRQAGMTLVAVAALMALGAPSAEAGMTCKVVPSWCPGGEGGQGVNNKSQTAGLSQHGKTPLGGNSSPGTGTSTSNNNNGLAFNGPGLSNPSPPSGDSSSSGTPGTSSTPGNNAPGSDSPPAITGPGSSTSTGSGGSISGGSSSAPTGVPEPATLLLLGVGASAAGAAAFRKRKK